MAASQFKVYTSSDVGGPGLLTGAAGTLGAILKACLVDGYSGHPAAGWSCPVAAASNIYSFQLGAGSTGCGFVLNDNGPNGTSTFKEAWITGWESISGVGSPVGSGTGQFPTPAQLLTSGHAVIRKSATADSTGRSWVIFADAYTLHLFIATGDSAGIYGGVYFGDFYSLKSTTDTYRCCLISVAVENTAANATGTGVAYGSTSLATASLAGHFIARSFGGGGTSITAGKHGDAAKQSGVSSLAGNLQTPNGPDNSYYISPIYLTESVASCVRGRLRGLYQLCHAPAGFADGQTIAGAGDFAGKEFYILRDAYAGTQPAAVPILIETSATVETN